ncbi:MAG TPA: hypothetical protein PLV39_01690 [Fimbriimonadaceae bacterium]|nr:hypothetical protein [Fimbriimonadaceae bacterium]
MSHGSANTFGRYALSLILAGLGIFGCKPLPPPSYSSWYASIAKPAPRADSAYQVYVDAAVAAERLPKDDLNRVSFTPGQRRRITKALAKVIEPVVREARRCEMPLRIFRPTEAPAYQRGWRLIGRALAWRVEDELAQGELEEAIRTGLAAFRFGFALGGGSASDAALGYQIVDDVRAALAPALLTLSPVDLTRLINGMSGMLRHRPSLESLLESERGAMRAAVQFVQDAYRAEDFDALELQLGPDAREPIRYLKDLRRRDGADRVRYFEGFAAEIDLEIKLLAERAKRPAEARGPWPAPSSEARPWKRLARHFFRTGRPLIDMDDRVTARTRLFVLNALVLRSIKETGAAPKSLSVFPADLTRDPYTGRPFRYAAAKAEYRLYSIGGDLRDDGGETDELGLSPDMTVDGGL